MCPWYIFYSKYDKIEEKGCILSRSIIIFFSLFFMDVDLSLLRILLFGRKEKKKKKKRNNQTNKQKIKWNLSKYFGIMKTGFHGQDLGLLHTKASNERAAGQSIRYFQLIAIFTLERLVTSIMILISGFTSVLIQYCPSMTKQTNWHID